MVQVSGRDQCTNKELAEGVRLGTQRLLHGLPPLACDLLDLPNVGAAAVCASFLQRTGIQLLRYGGLYLIWHF